MSFLKVKEELISKFNYVAGIVPIIKAYINEVHWLATLKARNYVF